MPALCEVVPVGEDKTKAKVRFNFHLGQWRAWTSTKRFVVVLSGAQAGKTAFGPIWLWREIQRRGPGDYMVVTPTYPLLIKKALPEFLRLFKRQLRLGDYSTQQKVFVFSADGERRAFGAEQADPTQVFFGHATDPESLESATAKGLWADEAGQKKFKLESWEALQRRLAIHQGRVLISTTPYSLGWLKQQLFDPWVAAKQDHKTIDIVNFASTQNPAFPPEEFERARASLPAWKFEMFYMGRFSRPAGLIYSSFDEARHKVPRFAIPPQWPRFLGLDFGGVNTAGVFFAEEQDINGKPTGRLIAYREYKAGERSAAEHCYHLLNGDDKNPPEPRIPLCAGGSKSEGQWRREFAAGGTVAGKRVSGIPIHGPAKPEAQSIEVGIQRVFAAFALGKILVFDDLQYFLDEVLSYSRELNEMGEPTEKIEAKETYHILDSVRYIIAHMNLDKPKAVLSGGVVAKPGLQNL